MSDPRYAPPAEDAKTPITPLDRKIARWKWIHAIFSIPIETASLTLPVLIVYHLISSNFESLFNLQLGIAVLVGALLVMIWIHSGYRLAMLKHQKEKTSNNRQIPQ
jgi:hypothetical protein